MTGALAHLAGRLADLQHEGLLRSSRRSLPPDTLVLCSNDYLGFAGEPPRASIEAPTGAGASRLISGDHPAHHAAEDAIARWVGADAALLMSSGYAANVGTITALAEAGDLVVSDALNHASIIDGCRLCHAEVAVVPHLDLDAIDAALARHRTGRRWVVTESYFSMDGDGPDLAALRALADRHRAGMIVDEAHAMGVWGQRGAGGCQEAGVAADVLIGTLGKAVGLQGAFVAGSLALYAWLWNRARSFVFSTAPSPWLATAIAARVDEVAAAHGRRERLARLVSRARERLGELGVPIAPSRGPILPWMVYDGGAAVTLSEQLLARGVFVQAIRPPTVPVGAARLRLTLRATLGDADLERALSAIASVARP